MLQILDSLYKVLFVKRMSWSDAELFCRNQGMYLWVVNSHTERESFFNLFLATEIENMRLNNEIKNTDISLNTMFIGLVKKEEVHN